MITAVSLNPSIDRTITVPQFVYGGMNRVTSGRNDASGKGVNVAICAARLGGLVSLVGFSYRENGHLVESRLRKENVPFFHVMREGAIRTNIKLLDESTGKVTEINSSGDPVDAQAVMDLTKLFANHMSRKSLAVLSGSMPPGCPKTLYRTLMEHAPECSCILDAEGEAFIMALSARPRLVKPNLPELEGICGRALYELSDIRQAAQELLARGAHAVVVSMGERGAMLVEGDKAYFAPALHVKARSTVGAGDAMVAALAVALDDGKPLPEALRMGVAAATASVMTEGTQLVTASDYNAALERVTVALL